MLSVDESTFLKSLRKGVTLVGSGIFKGFLFYETLTLRYWEKTSVRKYENLFNLLYDFNLLWEYKIYNVWFLPPIKVKGRNRRSIRKGTYSSDILVKRKSIYPLRFSINKEKRHRYTNPTHPARQLKSKIRNPQEYDWSGIVTQKNQRPKCGPTPDYYYDILW